MVAPRLGVLVLRCSDLDAARRFYVAIGLELQVEQHGSGPRHFVSVLESGLVLELYPGANGVIDRSRFEFDVEDIDRAAARLSAEGFMGDARADGLRAIDPDGRTVILHQRLDASPL